MLNVGLNLQKIDHSRRRERRAIFFISTRIAPNNADLGSISIRGNLSVYERKMILTDGDHGVG